MTQIINVQSLALVGQVELTSDEAILLDELNALAIAITFKIDLGIATDQDIQEAQRLIAMAAGVLETARGRMN